MAAAELRKAPAARRQARLGRATLRAYLTLWVITLACAVPAAVAGRARVRAAMRLALSATANAPPSLGHVLGLAAHNLPICAWPLLLGPLQLRGGSGWRSVADIAVAAGALANVLPVAAALGGYGPALAPYVPQLPLEWAALAVGYGSWTVERRQPLANSERLRLLGVLTLALLAAGALESYGVPHR